MVASIKRSTYLYIIGSFSETLATLGPLESTNLQRAFATTLSTAWFRWLCVSWYFSPFSSSSLWRKQAQHWSTLSSSDAPGLVYEKYILTKHCRNSSFVHVNWATSRVFIYRRAFSNVNFTLVLWACQFAAPSKNVCRNPVRANGRTAELTGVFLKQKVDPQK